MKPAILENLKALCILGEGEQEETIFSYLRRKSVETVHISSFDRAPELMVDKPIDLILLDADLEVGDIVSFFKHYKEKSCTIPVIALHNGGWGTRNAALIRMGAYDAFPKDIGRWNSEVYLDRGLVQAGTVKQLLNLSRTDHVTGLYNQRYLYESLKREMRRSLRTGSPLTIVLLDIDNFKDYNDTHGHLMGDKALAKVADSLLDSIRKGMDSAYRYGGDEFMLILPETDLKQATVSMERILQNVEAQVQGGLTFSIGESLLHSCSDIEPYIKSVDQAMYAAKKAGGNRIEVAVCDVG